MSRVDGAGPHVGLTLGPRRQPPGRRARWPAASPSRASSCSGAGWVATGRPTGSRTPARRPSARWPSARSGSPGRSSRPRSCSSRPSRASGASTSARRSKKGGRRVGRRRRRGALHRVPRARRLRVRPGLPARRAVRCAGPVRRLDRPDRRRAERPGSGGSAAPPTSPNGSRRPHRRVAAHADAEDATARAKPLHERAARARHYRETRLEPGDAVTIIGRALPFGDLSDPARREPGPGRGPALSDPEIAADLAAARAAGTLHDDPAEAWGNAAIPGFGIGRPVARPRWTPRRTRCRSRPPRTRPGSSGRSTSPPATSSSPRRPRCRCSSPTAPRTRPSTRGETILLGLLGASLAIVGDALRHHAQWRLRNVTPPEIAASPRSASSSGLAVFIGLSNYNAVIALQQRADKAWANIDVVLKQRHDMLPNLVSAVRGLMAYEQGVLTAVTQARAAYSPTDPIPAQAATSDHDRGGPVAVRRRRALPGHQVRRERPDLQAEIERIEGIIADRRELYNDQVYRYNTKIATVPASSWLGSSDGGRASSSKPTRPTTVRPRWSCVRVSDGDEAANDQESGSSATARPSGPARPAHRPDGHPADGRRARLAARSLGRAARRATRSPSSSRARGSGRARRPPWPAFRRPRSNRTWPSGTTAPSKGC